MLFNGVQLLLDFPDDGLIFLLQSKLEQNLSLVTLSRPRNSQPLKSASV
jgi:hypothetical protein